MRSNIIELCDMHAWNPANEVTNCKLESHACGPTKARSARTHARAYALDVPGLEQEMLTRHSTRTAVEAAAKEYLHAVAKEYS